MSGSPVRRLVFVALVGGAFVLAAKAGPVQSDLPTIAPASSDTTLTVSPTPLPGAAAAQAGAASAATDAAGKLADELLNAAQLGVGVGHDKTQPSAARAAAHPQPQPQPQPQSQQQPRTEASRVAPGGDELSALPPELRSFGKESLERIKSLLPWRDDEAPADGEPPVQVNWSNGSAAARSVDAARAARHAGSDKAHDEDAPGPPVSPRDNLLRDSLQVLQLVLTHPMTWLVISLLAIGAIAMSLADRRPK